MLFSSSTFLFFFLPLFLLGYFILPAQNGQKRINWRNSFLLVASLLFYNWGEGLVVIVLLLSATINYIAGLLIARSYRRAGLWVSLLGSLSLLFYYKYANFFVSGAIQTTHWLGGTWPFGELGLILLPIGISFYTFQGISYTLDVYWGRIEVNRSFIDYCTYVAMFPHQIAGPIVRYADIAPELSNRPTSSAQFAQGIERFIIGLAKKVLLANPFALIADTVFDAPVSSVSTSLAWLGILAYTLQIYFDFSGYTDMAIGLGRMIGFEFKENFNYPYAARSIQDFWRRWHISLSSWFRDYVYVPLGGNREGNFKTYRNLLIVFLVTGLWHGASWNFVVWGLFHGLFLMTERASLSDHLKKAPAAVGHFYTLLLIMVGWVFFRAANLGHAIQYLERMTGLTHAVGNKLIYPIALPTVLTFALGGLLALPLYQWWEQRWQKQATGFWYQVGYQAVLFSLFIVSVMYLAASTYNPFIYFRF